MDAKSIRWAINMILRVSRANLPFVSLFLLLLLLIGYEMFLNRLSFLDKHAVWKFVFLCLIFFLGVMAVIWKIWLEWQEDKLKRSRLDIENILRKRVRASFQYLSSVEPIYTTRFVKRLIRKYPNVFKRAPIKRHGDGVALVEEQPGDNQRNK